MKTALRFSKNGTKARKTLFAATGVASATAITEKAIEKSRKDK